MIYKKNGRTPYLTKLLSALLVIIMLAGAPLNGLALTASWDESASEWARETIKNAVLDGYVPVYLQDNYTSNITRSEFCGMVVRYIQRVTEMQMEDFLALRGVTYDRNVFSDTSDYNVAVSYALGITNGTDLEKKLFSPNGNITREQAATMILRLCEVIGMDTSERPDAGYADAEDISTWAADGINFCFANTIMTGTSVTPLTFSPKGMYTREQTIVSFSRIKFSTTQLNGIHRGDTEAEVDANNTLFKTIADSNGVWKLYGDYSSFLAVFYTGGTAEFVYTNKPDYGGDKAEYTVYTDKNDNGREYAASIGTYPGNDVSTTEQMIFEMTNAFRAIHGLAALVWNSGFADMARLHSEDMSVRAYFAHVSPDGKGPADRLDDYGYDWGACAENIIAGSREAAESVDAWINSAGHRSNMLTGSCTELGVGWFKASTGESEYGTYGTQLFGRPR